MTTVDRMRIGVVIQLTDLSITPQELGQAVEDRGFDSLYVPEHTHLPVRNSSPPSLVEGVTLDDYRRTLDPYVALTAVAAVTDRIKIGTSVALIAQHDPIVLAKEIATLDRVSAGRFVLGFGYGWNRDELEDHGIEYARRRAVTREKLLCMYALWSQDEAEFHGEFVNLAPSYSWPKPVQGARVQTLVGGGASPRLFETIAELCDGWMPIGGAGLSSAVPQLRQAFVAAGRDPDLLQIVPIGTIPESGKLARYQELGVTEVALRVPAVGRDDVLRRLDEYQRHLR